MKGVIMFEEKERIMSPGAYICKITKVENFQSEKSSTEAINIHFATIENKFGKADIYTKDKSGQEIGFNQEKLESLKKKLQIEDIYKMQDKILGLLIKIKKWKNFYNPEIDNIFNPKTFLTPEEVEYGLSTPLAIGRIGGSILINEQEIPKKPNKSNTVPEESDMPDTDDLPF